MYVYLLQRKCFRGEQYLLNTSITLLNFLSSPSEFHCSVLYISLASFPAWVNIIPILTMSDLSELSVPAKNHVSYSSNSFQFLDTFPHRESALGGLQIVAM